MKQFPLYLRNGRRALTAAEARKKRLSSRSILTFLLFIASILSIPSQAQPLAKGVDKFLGAGTSANIWTGFTSYWNQVTPGNDGKWGSVEYTQGQYNWSNLDAIYDYARSNGLRFKEHTLIWGAQQPSWIDGLDSAGRRVAVERWIGQVGQKYISMSFVDVVNEPFHSVPSYAGALGGSGTTGWDWVITAFQLARDSCAHGVKLLLNEYNILHDNGVTTNYINLINLLKARNLIDGIGIQGHYFEFRSHVGGAGGTYVWDINTIRGNLDRLAALGLPIYITEFDIDEPVDSIQLAQYKVYFPLLWTHPGVKGITLWGYIQNDVWTTHPDTYLLHSDGSERPAMRWLRNFVALPFPPTLVSPLGTSGEYRNPLLVWNASKRTTAYRVQVSTSNTFSTVALDTTVADTVVRVSPLPSGTGYYWHASAINDSGMSAYSGSGMFTTGDQVLAVHQQERAPIAFALEQNYPNPFNPTTMIKYTVGGVRAQGLGFSEVRIAIFDVMGREVATVVDARQAPGTYEVKFDGSRLASGVYFYRLTADAKTAVRAMNLVK